MTKKIILLTGLSFLLFVYNINISKASNEKAVLNILDVVQKKIMDSNEGSNQSWPDQKKEFKTISKQVMNYCSANRLNFLEKFATQYKTELTSFMAENNSRSTADLIPDGFCNHQESNSASLINLLKSQQIGKIKLDGVTEETITDTFLKKINELRIPKDGITIDSSNPCPSLLELAGDIKGAQAVKKAISASSSVSVSDSDGDSDIGDENDSESPVEPIDSSASDARTKLIKFLSIKKQLKGESSIIDFVDMNIPGVLNPKKKICYLKCTLKEIKFIKILQEIYKDKKTNPTNSSTAVDEIAEDVNQLNKFLITAGTTASISSPSSVSIPVISDTIALAKANYNNCKTQLESEDYCDRKQGLVLPSKIVELENALKKAGGTSPESSVAKIPKDGKKLPKFPFPAYPKNSEVPVPLFASDLQRNVPLSSAPAKDKLVTIDYMAEFFHEINKLDHRKYIDVSTDVAMRNVAKMSGFKKMLDTIFQDRNAKIAQSPPPLDPIPEITNIKSLIEYIKKYRKTKGSLSPSPSSVSHSDSPDEDAETPDSPISMIVPPTMLHSAAFSAFQSDPTESARRINPTGAISLDGFLSSPKVDTRFDDQTRIRLAKELTGDISFFHSTKRAIPLLTASNLSFNDPPDISSASPLTDYHARLIFPSSVSDSTTDDGSSAQAIIPAVPSDLSSAGPGELGDFDLYQLSENCNALTSLPFSPPITALNGNIIPISSSSRSTYLDLKQKRDVYNLGKKLSKLLRVKIPPVTADLEMQNNLLKQMITLCSGSSPVLEKTSKAKEIFGLMCVQHERNMPVDVTSKEYLIWEMTHPNPLMRPPSNEVEKRLKSFEATTALTPITPIGPDSTRTALTPKGSDRCLAKGKEYLKYLAKIEAGMKKAYKVGISSPPPSPSAPSDLQITQATNAIFAKIAPYIAGILPYPSTDTSSDIVVSTGITSKILLPAVTPSLSGPSSRPEILIDYGEHAKVGKGKFKIINRGFNFSEGREYIMARPNPETRDALTNITAEIAKISSGGGLASIFRGSGSTVPSGIVSPMRQIYSSPTDPIFTQPLYSGGDLYRILTKNPTLASSLKAQEQLSPIIERHILSGLSHIHAQGVAHLDIKPENFFIDLNESESTATSATSTPVKSAHIGDFGSATRDISSSKKINPGATTTHYYVDPVSIRDCNPDDSVHASERLAPYESVSQAQKADVFATAVSLMRLHDQDYATKLENWNFCLSSICSPGIETRGDSESHRCDGDFAGIKSAFSRITPTDVSAKRTFFKEEFKKLIAEHNRKASTIDSTNGAKLVAGLNNTSGTKTKVRIDKKLLLWLMSHPDRDYRPTSQMANYMFKQIEAGRGSFEFEVGNKQIHIPPKPRARSMR